MGLNRPIDFQSSPYLDFRPDCIPGGLPPTPADQDLPFEGGLEDGLYVSCFLVGGFLFKSLVLKRPHLPVAASSNEMGL